MATNALSPLEEAHDITDFQLSITVLFSTYPLFTLCIQFFIHRVIINAQYVHFYLAAAWR